MNIELLIYCYIAICLAMIVFNLICIFVFKERDRRLQKRSTRFERSIEKQIENIRNGKEIDEKHLRYLYKKLPKLGYMMAFDETVTSLLTDDGEAAENYIFGCKTVFTYLAFEYVKKDRLQTAYFAYVLSKFHISKNMSFDTVMDVMLSLLSEDSLYCRENALQALYSFGYPESIVQGLKMIDRNQRYHNSRLLTNGLLTFAGDHDKLIALLWQAFEDFSVEIKVSVLNYIRFQSGQYQKQMMRLMADGTQNDELRFAAIRYFGKYPYDAAYPYLIRFAANQDQLRWEYQAVSVSCLSLYPSEEAIRVLKDALHSSNWYVRYNSAGTLRSIGVPYSELADVLNGNDRYAREMLQYHLELMKDEKRRKKTAEVSMI